MVFPVVIVAAVLLAATVVMSRILHKSPPAAAALSTPSAQNRATAAEPVRNATQPISTPSPRHYAAPSAAPSNTSGGGPAKTEFSPAQTISDLDDLMISNHPEQEKLGVMLATLGGPDKDLRAAALEHIKELDDRDAVAQLQDLSDRTEDAQDKAALQDVIDYLNLPSLTERSVAGRSSGPLVPKNSTWRDRRMTHTPQNASVKPAAPNGK